MVIETRQTIDYQGIEYPIITENDLRFIELPDKSRLFYDPKFDRLFISNDSDLTEESKKEFFEDNFQNYFFELPGIQKFEMYEKIANYFNCNPNLYITNFLSLLDNWKTTKRKKTLVIYIASPSSGKNYTLDFVIQLFKKEHYIELTSTTARSLLYDAEIHKPEVRFLIIPEWQKNQIEWENIIKSFIDGKQIHKETIREENQNITKTHNIPSLGVQTTLSFDNLTPDFIHRGIILTIDETNTKTNQISDFQDSIEKKIIERESYTNDQYFKRCEELSKVYDLLKWDYVVKIDTIINHGSFKNLYPRVKGRKFRRDKGKIFDTLRTIVLLNQKKRRELVKGNKKYLFAEFEDYYILLKYCSEIFSDIFLEMDKFKIYLLNLFNLDENTNGYLEDEDEIKLSITQAFNKQKETYGKVRKTISNKLFGLANEGYLKAEQKDPTKEKSMYIFSLGEREFIPLDKMNIGQHEQEINNLVEQDFEFFKNTEDKILYEKVFDDPY